MAVSGFRRRRRRGRVACAPWLGMVKRYRRPAYFPYDAAGNRIMMQDGSGVTYWAYDALDRSFRQEGI